MRKLSNCIAAAAAVLAGFAAPPAWPQEAQIRKVVEPKLGGVKIEAVSPTPVPGVYEVRFQGRDGPQVVYSDAQGNYIFTGHLIDAKTDRDLTEEQLQKLSTIDFKTLPLDLAVKIQRGNGRRVLAMFSDPYCPYCRRFEQTLLQMDDVTIYVFMYPVIRPENADQSRSVWCSKDRARAWLDLAASEPPKVPTAAPTCANPVSKILELGRSLRVNGTPTLYFANGEKVGGGLPIEQLRVKLDEIAKQARK